MDLTNEFDHLSLDSFERNNVSAEHSFVGLTIDSRITDALADTEDPVATVKSSSSGRDVTVERFFEECYDAGVEVFSESNFEKQMFIGSGATMEVYKSQWKDRGQTVALK